MVDQLLAKYGPRRSAWPKKLLKNLEERNAALTAAILERVGFVPKELFWPVGQAAKDLLTNKLGGRGAPGGGGGECAVYGTVQRLCVEEGLAVSLRAFQQNQCAEPLSVLVCAPFVPQVCADACAYGLLLYLPLCLCLSLSHACACPDDEEKQAKKKEAEAAAAAAAAKDTEQAGAAAAAVAPEPAAAAAEDSSKVQRRYSEETPR